MRRKWEYHVQAVPAEQAAGLLQHAGADGWELVQVMAVGIGHPMIPNQATPGVQCFFKRPAAPEVNLRESVGLPR